MFNVLKKFSKIYCKCIKYFLKFHRRTAVGAWGLKPPHTNFTL